MFSTPCDCADCHLNYHLFPYQIILSAFSLTTYPSITKKSFVYIQLTILLQLYYLWLHHPHTSNALGSNFHSSDQVIFAAIWIYVSNSFLHIESSNGNGNSSLPSLLPLTTLTNFPTFSTYHSISYLLSVHYLPISQFTLWLVYSLPMCR